MRCGLEEILPCPARSLDAFVGVEHLIINSLTFAYIEDIKKVRDRLGIINTGASAYNDGFILTTFRSEQVDPRKVKDLKNVCVTHLILESDAEEIKVFDRILAFNRKKRDMLLPHDRVKIGPRRIDSLTIRVFTPVKHVVEYHDAEM